MAFEPALSDSVGVACLQQSLRTIGNFGCSRSTISPDGPDSWTVPLRQEIPLHLQLTDLLVLPGDQGGVVLCLVFLTVAEDTGGAVHKSFFQA